MPAFNYESSFNGSAPSRMPANVYSGNPDPTAEEAEKSHENWEKGCKMVVSCSSPYTGNLTLYYDGDIVEIIRTATGNRIPGGSLQVGSVTTPQQLVNAISWNFPGTKLA